MFSQFLVAFFVLNAIFWGLFSHEAHCSLLAKVSKMACPPHHVHLLMGVISFIAAVVIRQKEYLFKK
jgi:hypothetical protein